MKQSEYNPAEIPYKIVDDFPALGLTASLHFLKWIIKNPEGAVSLPTGKTPEYFIKWTKFFLDNWNTAAADKLLEQNSIDTAVKPDLRRLTFVQIDEFYPINPNQHNSFYNYVQKYYLDLFKINPETSLLINCDKIPLKGGKHFSEIFPESLVDLSLRYRHAKTNSEKLQQDSIFMIDDWCDSYEEKIRKLGGIGFFMGGIGPDGHIAFNVKGSSHFSTTRLAGINFETQAAAAADLGGIEISRNRNVITIGLETITYNKNVSAVIIAAGEAKAGVVKDAVESTPSVNYPATVLAKRKGSCFYITKGAASCLSESVISYYRDGDWTAEKKERAVTDLCVRLNKYGSSLIEDDLKSDAACCLIPELSLRTPQEVRESIIAKISRGIGRENSTAYYHTGPHHDDIMLGLLPKAADIIREESNKSYFSIMTSGFTSVTNSFIADLLSAALDLIKINRIEMINYPDFFEKGYKYKRDKDVYHVLNNIASGSTGNKRRGFAHRLVRELTDINGIRNIEELKACINSILLKIENSYDGEKNPPEIQRLKGSIREFEEELVWGHFGVKVENISHLRLGFYTGDVFTRQPEQTRDALPILKQLKEIKPDVISLAMDPEGSGPDTHYKVLQAIAEALRMWQKTEDLSALRIWGYRNVWHTFHPAEADIIVPVSLDMMDVLENSFTECYLSQVKASFPSYKLDGRFSTLMKKIWVSQLKTVQLLLGKDYFYENKNPRIRSAHGLLFLKEMGADEFLAYAGKLEKSTEGFYAM